ncbi:MAG TPA: nuclear transport factor 2 family protein [Puia sp.]|nr:nuclear transport factor 2 family protein [Puia sp.]
MKKWYVTLMLALAAGAVVAQNRKPVEQGKEEKAVSAAVENLRKAMIDPDKTALEKLTLPELSYGHSSGVVQNQVEFVEALTSGKSDFVSIELTGQTISIVNNTAVVRHYLSAVTNDGGKPGQTKLSILLVWEKQKGEWRLLARQAVKVQQAL